MASIKQVVTASPFQFRNIRQHLLPPFEDVKVAKLTWNPAVKYNNYGFLRSSLYMFYGKTTKRLCEKTYFHCELSSGDEVPTLDLEYFTGEKRTIPLDKYKTTRELLIDLKTLREEIQLSNFIFESSLAFDDAAGDADQGGTGKSKPKKKK